MEKPLNENEKSVLLEIARKAIEAKICTGEDYVEPREEKALNMRNGCFVTIKQNGELRGCIGNFQSELPLFKEVAEMAIASATKDPRFYPFKEEDLEDYSIEISVLSPLQKIEDIEEIELGKHGIYLEKGYYRGVLLPQVATEHEWDRHTFLKQTCVKAGLPTDAWQAEDAEIYIFSAQIFGEGAGKKPLPLPRSRKKKAAAPIKAAAFFFRNPRDWLRRPGKGKRLPPPAHPEGSG